MSSFDDRKKGFEGKFAHDEKILFKKELKKCSLEDRIKATPESDQIIACETLLDIQDKI